MDRNHADETDAAETDGTESTTTSRRRLLQTTAATAIGGAGLAGASGSASASGFTGCDDWLDAPAEYPEIDLTSSNPTATNVDDFGDDPVVVFVHGWLGRETSTDQAYTLERAFEEAEYDGRVVAASWASDTLNYWKAEGTTETAGRRLASWLATDRIDLEETTVRLVGHSLGGRLCLEALAVLGDDATVDSVALVGAAADDDSVCTDGEFAYGIETGADAVFNYHSENDDSVCYGYEIQSLSSGLGCGGADCSGGWITDDSGTTPDDYTDVDVTATVADHCAYIKPEVGCVPQMVEDFESQ
ncbi:alpha/beta hydrolase [Haloterrigena sp. SYSU A121-1]|uniref:Alpha/beta hydrolase n=1 Tax=Haloterrigena gelatinilytica TaxID=2741724 RepID=A0A8J8GMI5_9EURY|nr:alpha/beta hydrolase [Haloterrigena gelatinilytica]NUB90542.1 alpha/beta hydrolase [Haloterrigena gelatinilytica]